MFRALILRKRINQVDLARELGVSEGQLSKMLRGNRHINVEQLRELAVGMNVSMSEVFTQVESDLGVQAQEAASESRRFHSAAQREDPGRATSFDLEPAELARRLDYSIASLIEGDEAAQNMTVATAMRTVSARHLAAIREGTIRPNNEIVQAIAELIGVDPAYFAAREPADIELIEAELEVVKEMRIAGVSQVAARGFTAHSPEALRSISALIRKGAEQGP
ncbi:helix-turn-helix domain-containing protein [Leifsonia sp. McL0607]|uniref:helix-turn-helix domain-containing protein n=1 Tax=Leifsonia sp. McL0607 TaxID=3415672 RepID=UPI003CF5F7CA